MVLLCVWWEPADANAYPVFAARADAATRLAGAFSASDASASDTTSRSQAEWHDFPCHSGVNSSHLLRATSWNEKPPQTARLLGVPLRGFEPRFPP